MLTKLNKFQCYINTPHIGDCIDSPGVMLSLTGLISLSASLPNEEHVYVVEVEAYDGGGLTSVHPATVYISVMGTNFPRPSFDRATYSFSVPEMTGQHSVVGQVLATITGDNTQGNYPLAVMLHGHIYLHSYVVICAFISFMQNVLIPKNHKQITVIVW